MYSSELPVAILAGGMATRLRPITEKIPKLLVEVAGEPFFSHQLRLLQQNGLTRVVLCVGYLGEQIVQLYGDGARWRVKIEYAFDGPKLRGTRGAPHRLRPRRVSGRGVRRFFARRRRRSRRGAAGPHRPPPARGL